MKKRIVNNYSLQFFKEIEKTNYGGQTFIN